MRPIKPILYLSGIAALSMVVACEEEIPPPVYQLIPANVRDIIVSASAAGVVEPIQTVEVKSKASGEILNVAVETGSVVSRGDLLVRVDQRVPQNAVTQAEADLDVARAQLTNAESQFASIRSVIRDAVDYRTGVRRREFESRECTGPIGAGAANT